MRDEWETPPTVDGVIVLARIGKDGDADILHVQPDDVAEDLGNLLQVIGDPDNPDPKRPIMLCGMCGRLVIHGYEKDEDLIGKRCVIYSGGRYDYVAIEPPTGEHWALVPWVEYV